MDELSSGSGELKNQVTTIGGVITSAQQTPLDEFVASPGGVGGMHAKGLGYGVEVLRAAAGDHHQYPKLRQRYVLFHACD